MNGGWSKQFYHILIGINIQFLHPNIDMIAIGEMVAIANCTNILTDPNGSYRLSPSEAQEAFKDLTLYTNAESCPMVSSIAYC